MKENQEVIAKLADVIEAHPNAYIEIDNDVWYIYDETGEIENQIASSGEYKAMSNWYSYGNQYGHLVADALVEILNRNGFNLRVSAV